MGHIRKACQRAGEFEHVGDGNDSVCGVCAVPAVILTIDPAEPVAVETMRLGVSKIQALSEGIDS